MIAFTLTIRTDGAAFTDEATGEPMPLPEVARILRNVADRIDGDGSTRVRADQYLYDVNGNRAGEWKLADA